MFVNKNVQKQIRWCHDVIVYIKHPLLSYSAIGPYYRYRCQTTV